jgi:predicted dienelactone hydrolase
MATLMARLPPALSPITYPGAGDLPARVYTPQASQGPLPVVLYFHGGGFVIADIETYDAAPRALAALTNMSALGDHPSSIIKVFTQQGQQRTLMCERHEVAKGHRRTLAVWLLRSALGHTQTSSSWFVVSLVIGVASLLPRANVADVPRQQAGAQ